MKLNCDIIIYYYLRYGTALSIPKRVTEKNEKRGVFLNKIKVAVIFGGASSEHDVSTVSAKGVISNIDRDKYELYLLGITKEGEWYLYDGSEELLPEDKWLQSEKLKKAVISPDPSVHGIVTEDGEVIKIDVIFPVLHGKNGEDGTIQGLFQIAKIAFVGCDSTSSGVCMDKRITNAVADAYNIPQAKWCAINEFDYKASPNEFIEDAVEKLSLPIFVKPANAGSSVGITKAKTVEELKDGIEKAFKEDKKIVLEEFVDGYEVECAVLGNEAPITAEVGQINSCKEFYDYEAKYINPASELIIPANISEKKRNEVAQNAIKAYKAFGCEGLSRVDFFVTKKDGKVLFNEINTLPGFTPISMYSKLFEAKGIGYGELVDNLIELAISRGDNF